MAYKQSPFPYAKGTKKHASALKGKFAQVGAATPNEDELPSAVKAHKTGHAQMDVDKWTYEGSASGGEGQDQNKIYDKAGNHVGNYVMTKDGKEVKQMFKSKKSTESAHGQLSDAEMEYQEDLEREKSAAKKLGCSKCNYGKLKCTC
tara:strand:+ start:1060 stop:1500 length:441 start_codon:yes stop_codon:yes gene_type:complete